MLLKLILYLIAAVFVIKILQYLTKNTPTNGKKYRNIANRKKPINVKDVKDAEFEEIEDK